MAEKNPKKMKTQSDYLSDSNSLEEEVSQHLRTSPEERLYSTIKGLVQVTQMALAHTMAHTVYPHGRKRTAKTAKDQETP